MTQPFKDDFPAFHESLSAHEGADLEHFLPGLTDAQVTELEQRLGVPLPISYKRLLRVCRGFWLLGGAVQLGPQHPFFHRFPTLDELSLIQRQTVARKGGAWPPPSEGMLCFAEYFLEADGDQVLWDVSKGLQNGEYPVFYYAHEDRPPSVRKIADSFDEWLAGCIEEFD